MASSYPVVERREKAQFLSYLDSVCNLCAC